MEVFLIKAFQLILAFAILVIIHEFGHFLFARMFGIRVEKFYIFFDPWTEIFKWKPREYWGVFGRTKKLKNSCSTETKDSKESSETISENEKNSNESSETISENEKNSNESSETISEGGKKKKKGFWGDTEYGIGWLPLGGYCKISGMIDESMDTEQLAKPAEKWEFRSKPAWQRLLVMIAGVLFNFLLAILIYAGIVYATGEKYVPFSEAKMGMEYSGEARKIGFHNGDIPLLADGKPLGNPAEARMEMIQAREVTVLRDGDTVNIAIPEKFIFALDNEAKSDTAMINFMTYRIPTRITQVVTGEGAAKGGIEVGDEILAIDSVATPTLTDFLTTLQGHENQTVALTVARRVGERTDTLTKQVKLSNASKMGVGLEIDPSAFYNYEEKHYGVFESIPRGIEMGTEKLVSYAKSMKMVFTKEGANSIGGFGAIGSIFPERWDWIAFWNIAAFLSVALAFMNILPIPALDGGHVLFLLYEVIFRRKPSDKFMEYAQWFGMTLLILLLVYANGMDIVRLFK